jgi:ubiquinone/menaquinone biosynthesis C-methylase UbiE
MSALGLLDRARYRAQQHSLRLQSLVVQETARRLGRMERQELPADVVRQIRDRFRALLDRDLDNVEAGLYPRELLFQIPFADYARALPRLVADTPRVLRRAKREDFRDIPDVDRERFPAYYRRTFHWQSDGYFSAHSASVYDVGVELLFAGTADIMRRQVIPPVSRFLAESGTPPERVRLLDVACGTGRTLSQLAMAHPRLRYWGVDLSPPYVQAARKLLRDVADVSLVVENAETLPFLDGLFDVVTSVFLFHELPRATRRRVLREAFRVLRPGGLLVLEDSAQLAESGPIAAALAAFPERYHEPFYADYVEDDLAAIAREVGFEAIAVEPHLVAKVLVARKPDLTD